MILAQPYDDHAAMRVLSRLDANDLVEAGLIRGAQPNHLALFAEWRMVQAAAIVSKVLVQDAAHGGAAFAVLLLGNTGQAGVAQAALLARPHQRFRRALAQAALRIRREMPEFCASAGIHRIEARCWTGHPTAAGFLRATGFRHETDMPGFGADGAATFSQFAWTKPQPEGDQ